jgi:hypothetical protein
MVFVMEWYFDLIFADIGFPLASAGQNIQARPYATPQYSPYLVNNQYVIPPYIQQQHVQANHHMLGLNYINRQPPCGHFIPPFADIGFPLASAGDFVVKPDK